MASPRDRRIWIGIAVVGLLALTFGLWDLLVERDGGENPLWQVGLPGLLVVIALVQAWKDDAPDPAEEPHDATPAAAVPEPPEERSAFASDDPAEEGRADRG